MAVQQDPFDMLGVSRPTDLPGMASRGVYRPSNDSNYITPYSFRSPSGGSALTGSSITPSSLFGENLRGSSPSGGGQAGLLDQMAQTLRWEYGEKQAAADRQWSRNTAESDALRSFIGGAPGKMERGYQSVAGEIDRMAGSLGSMSDQFGQEARGMISDMVGRGTAGIDKFVGQGVNDMRGAAEGAVATARGAVEGYSMGVVENAIQATVAGMRQGMRNTMNMVAKGLNPDGTQMTQAERMEATAKLRYDTGLQVAQVVSGVRMQAQETLAGLKMNLAGVQLQAGSLKGQAAELGLKGEEAKGNIRAQGLQGLLATQEGQRAFQSMITDLVKFKGQLRSATDASSLQLELEGRRYLADSVRENPETIMGLLSGMMALATIQSAPGGANLRGLNFGSGGRYA